MNKRKTKDQAVIRPVQKEAISEIRAEEDFVEFLRRELEWPIPYNIQKLSDVTIPHDLQKDFGFDPVEDRIAISRLLNLTDDQPWGVFLFEFKTKRPYLTHLRKILRVLGSQKTLMKGNPIWDREDLLFICTSDWSQFQFAHFSGKKAESAVISTFGWRGPEDPFLHTLCKHNLPRLRMPSPETGGGYNADKWRDTWKEAFNVKPVTDEFYATLKEVFDAVQSGITGLDGEERRFFAELVVNRLIFLKFVEKKGWLDGDRDYLYNKFKTYGKNDFWGDFLCHLFFEGLCQEPADRSQTTNAILGEVPFLNAELFSPSEKWDDWNIRVNNRAFDLLFDKLLNPYNFTVCETSPLDIEVAFNQDLLGYGYEELIADQHGQGAYYTHPTEVNLMCRQSLWAYLENRCPEVNNETIGRLLYSELNAEHSISQQHALLLYKALHEVTVVDPALGSGTFPVAMMKHLFLALTTLGKILERYPDYRGLIEQGALTDHDDPFALKLHIIERSIYGCDIDYFAVQIAKLRFWIELMVDCERPEALPNFDCKLVFGDALVSVVGTDDKGKTVTLEEYLGHPTKSSGQGDLFHSIGKQAIEELGQLKHEYFNAKTVENRQTLETLIKDKQQELLLSVGIELDKITVTDKHVLWQIDFAEIFSGENPGFDIAIANPPYLRQELIESSFKLLTPHLTKKDLLSLYARISDVELSGKSDLYAYFYIRCLDLLSQDGIQCFICSTSWLDVDFGIALKRFVLKFAEINSIITSTCKRSFEFADINTSISIIKKCGDKSTNRKIARFISFRVALDTVDFEMMYKSISTNATMIYDNIVVTVENQDQLEIKSGLGFESASQQIPCKYAKWGIFLRAPVIYHTILTNHCDKLIEIGEIAEVKRGITSGVNDFFYLDKDAVDRFGIEERYIKPLLFSFKEVDKYCLNDKLTNKYVFLCYDSMPELIRSSSVGALSYIEYGEKQGFDRKTTMTSRKQWYSLQKQDISDFIQGQIINDRFFFAQNNRYLVDCVINMLYLKPEIRNIAWAVQLSLNSTLTALMSELNGRTSLGEGALKIQVYELKNLLIVDPRLVAKIPGAQDAIRTLSQRQAYSIFKELQIDQDNIDFHQVVPLDDRENIDSIVFDLLGLTLTQRQQVYTETLNLVYSRLNKAKNL